MRAGLAALVVSACEKPDRPSVSAASAMTVCPGSTVKVPSARFSCTMPGGLTQGIRESSTIRIRVKQSPVTWPPSRAKSAWYSSVTSSDVPVMSYPLACSSVTSCPSCRRPWMTGIVTHRGDTPPCWAGGCKVPATSSWMPSSPRLTLP